MHRLSKPLRNLCIYNRQARFQYTLLDVYTAGIALLGTEIKSIRLGKANLQEAYCYFSGAFLWVKNMYIAPYSHGNTQNHDERRERKLLLQKKELRKLMRSKDKGLTIVPTRLFICERGFAKIDIALAKGKKLYEKKRVLKERDLDRALRSGQM